MAIYILLFPLLNFQDEPPAPLPSPVHPLLHRFQNSRDKKNTQLLLLLKRRFIVRNGALIFKSEFHFACLRAAV